MTVFTVLVQPLAKLIQSTSSQSTSERPILILSSPLFQVASFLHVSHQSPVGISLPFRRSNVSKMQQEQRCNRRQNKKKERRA